VGLSRALETGGRPRPALFRALGKHEPPVQVDIAGQVYRRAAIFKHDSWAATALYVSPSGNVVCKFNRRKSILGLPMRWLGRLLARRETRILGLLAGAVSVPRPRGPVLVAGRAAANAAAHDYVPGHPLRVGEAVNNEFFPRLRELLRNIHGRGIAYVDLHKRENILVGDDGRPYLIDFQISVAWPKPLRFLGFLQRALLRLLQRSDEYHLVKHVSLCRPDQVSLIARGLAAGRPWWIRLHRAFAVPFRWLRRRLLVVLGIRRGRGRAASEYFPEEAVRRESATIDTSHIKQVRIGTPDAEHEHAHADAERTATTVP
jgi:predicted Ser/Thr protein kinase